MANGTITKISTVIVPNGGQAAMSFTNISQDYDDLLIYISGRYTGAESAQSMGFHMSINGVTTNRNYRVMQAYGGNSIESTTGTIAYIGVAGGTSSTAGVFNSAQVYINNYKTSNSKSFWVDFVSENNIANNYGTGFVTGKWSDNSPITSLSIYPSGSNWAEFSTATLYGITRIPNAAKATGGIITDDTSYWYHTFTSSGIFIPNQNITADCLVIAGGGGGGGITNSSSGGGGAGGLRGITNRSFSNATSYAITIGAGGSAGASGNNAGGKGITSSITGSGFTAINATGGGGGGSNGVNPSIGGSGGGGGGSTSVTNGAAGNEGAYSPVEGYSGGNGSSDSQWYAGSAGGGGAGAAGSNGSTTNPNTGNGGTGVNTYSTWGLSTFTGHNVNGTVWYAGGGGGGGRYPAGFGGNGGGGHGGYEATGGNGLMNTGSGGGGSSGPGSRTGGGGGSGIVIIRYAK